MSLTTELRHGSGYGLNGNQLKLIAVISMLLDHIGVLLVGRGVILHGADTEDLWMTGYQVLRSVGRVAFPIYCFLLVEGFFHTRDWKKYVLRLGIFAVISECFFDQMVTGSWVDFGQQNVFWSLLIGLLMMQVLKTIQCRVYGQPGLLIQLMIIILCCGFAWICRTDYGYIGIMLIALFYLFHGDPKNCCMSGFLWMMLMTDHIYYVLGLVVAFLLIYSYNGMRGGWKGKHFFYLFYPVHMLILDLIYIGMF